MSSNIGFDLNNSSEFRLSDANQSKINSSSWGDVFKMDNLGQTFNTVGAGLSVIGGLDNLFGSGRKDRKLARNNLNQQMAQNAEALQMIRDDRADFKNNRTKITNSYMGK
jgi:hypothetical protein